MCVRVCVRASGVRCACVSVRACVRACVCGVLCGMDWMGRRLDALRMSSARARCACWEVRPSHIFAGTRAISRYLFAQCPFYACRRTHGRQRCIVRLSSHAAHRLLHAVLPPCHFMRSAAQCFAVTSAAVLTGMQEVHTGLRCASRYMYKEVKGSCPASLRSVAA